MPGITFYWFLPEFCGRVDLAFPQSFLESGMCFFFKYIFKIII